MNWGKFIIYIFLVKNLTYFKIRGLFNEDSINKLSKGLEVDGNTY